MNWRNSGLSNNEGALQVAAGDIVKLYYTPNLGDDAIQAVEVDLRIADGNTLTLVAGAVIETTVESATAASARLTGFTYGSEYQVSFHFITVGGNRETRTVRVLATAL